MKYLALGAVVIGAAVFIAVSALMNALFLSSMGRTPMEAGLLAAVSLAADLVKAVLPIVLMRALLLRAWTQVLMAALMLGVMLGLSLTSGTGFAALTRGAATAGREAQGVRLADLERDLKETETRLDAIATVRAVTVIEAELAAAERDRRWVGSKACGQPTGAAARRFCADVTSWRTEHVAAVERDRLTGERQRLRGLADGLRVSGAGLDSDPQAGAIADLLGIDRRMPRLVLTTSIAVVLEVGSVILVLLAAGPTLLQWRKRKSARKSTSRTKVRPAEVPLQPDRAHWQRQRGKGNLTTIERV